MFLLSQISFNEDVLSVVFVLLCVSHFELVHLGVAHEITVVGYL